MTVMYFVVYTICRLKKSQLTADEEIYRVLIPLFLGCSFKQNRTAFQDFFQDTLSMEEDLLGKMLQNDYKLASLNRTG